MPHTRPSRATHPASARSTVPNTPPILPIAERLGADDRFAGRGVTIAFLDSGFYAHPDLTTPRNRIRAYCDVLEHRTFRTAMPEPDASSWHGMMTSVVCAGNGAQSDGRYRGLAHEADVVLVKVGTMSRIRHDDIRAGIQWVLNHRQKYGIRVLNISCGGDYEASYLLDPVCQAAEEAVRQGVVVVVAVGNSGNDPNHVIVPPASTPAVITVGGFDDAKDAELGKVGHYHSSYGPTIDGLQKPEVIAPAIWLAAPILPGTPTAAQAALLAALERAPDEELRGVLHDHRGVDPELDATADRDAYMIRNLVNIKRRDQKVISRHYKHVDGTSFSAPIVASVVAQMLEANPALTPQQVKRILIATSARLPEVSIDQQGWGVIKPATAVARALAMRL
jgi:serine protease AprX